EWRQIQPDAAVQRQRKSELETRVVRTGRNGRVNSRASLDEPVCSREKLRLAPRSEEYTSELQSRFDLVCRHLLDKKNAVIIDHVFALDAPRALRLSPYHRDRAIYCIVDLFTFYLRRRHVFRLQCLKFRKDAVSRT